MNEFSHHFVGLSKIFSLLQSHVYIILHTPKCLVLYFFNYYFLPFSALMLGCDILLRVRRI